MGEIPPFRLVGWGGGGENVYRHALAQPADVDALIFLDTYGDAIEWRSWAAANGASSAAMMNYRAADLLGRWKTFLLLRLVAVPFGLGPLLFRPDASSYDFPERFLMYKWFYWTSKTWTSQWFTLRSSSAQQSGWLASGFLDYHGVFDRRDSRLDGKPVLHIMSRPSNGTTSFSSDSQVTQAGFEWNDRLFVANVTGNPHHAVCAFEDCDQGFPLRYPGFTADAILSHFGATPRDIASVMDRNG